MILLKVNVLVFSKISFRKYVNIYFFFGDPSHYKTTLKINK